MALLTALAPSYHNLPNGSASLIRSTPRSIFARSDFVNVYGTNSGHRAVELHRLVRCAAAFFKISVIFFSNCLLNYPVRHRCRNAAFKEMQMKLARMNDDATGGGSTAKA